MVRRILKWSAFHPDGLGMIGNFPRGKVVLVAPQHPSNTLPTLWIEHEVQDLSPHVSRGPDIEFEAAKDIPTDKYIVVSTGYYVLQDDFEHVGSCVCADGELVWHVYKAAE